jgi:hypothetical protein
VVDDEVGAAGPERAEHRGVEARDVGRGHELVVQVVVVLCRKDQIERLGRGELTGRPGEQSHVAVVRLVNE